MHTSRTLAMAFVMVAAIGAARTATAQDAQSQHTIQLSELPPEAHLGVRVEGVRRNLPVARTVVVVPDVSSYLEAISQWTMERRFPILIHDGSGASRERIARFVRAFEPDEVVRWEGDGSFDLDTGESVETRRRRLEDIVARSWGADDRTTLTQQWLDLGFAPPGVVVTSLRDRAWPGAVALAAGRGQLVQWLDQPLHGGLGGVMSDADLQRLVGSIADGLNRENIAWRQLGDIIDAVTLCLNAPTKYANPNPQTPGPLALTDRVGRHENSARWAWCGQLFGDEGESVWRAMCALFLQPTKAWFFDGYQGKAQFAEYEIEPAVEQFTLRGFEVDVASMTGGDANAWRAHARLGIDAGFIHVNTSGVSRRFNLASGRPYGSDIPMLWMPAITHFIHSFSAQNLNDSRSIARIWFERGAYAYVGSVHEPFLTAFHTPESLAMRLFAPAPLAVAASRDLGRPWRVAILGDPLITFGPQAPVADAPTFESATSVESSMREMLRDGNLEGGLDALVMLGRDADAARLVRTLIRTEPDKLTPGIADAGWRSLLRTGQLNDLLALIPEMSEAERSRPELGDLLWLALRPQLAMGDIGAITALRTRIRAESFSDDVIDLAAAIERAEGREAARAWITSMRSQTKSQRHLKNLNDAMRRQ